MEFCETCGTYHEAGSCPEQATLPSVSGSADSSPNAALRLARIVLQSKLYDECQEARELTDQLLAGLCAAQGYADQIRAARFMDRALLEAHLPWTARVRSALGDDVLFVSRSVPPDYLEAALE